MKTEMRVAESKLRGLRDAHEPTADLYVRVRGDHLILGRSEPIGPNAEMENDDRVRLTRLSASAYGLSVKRHTGRWERTPFSGSMEDMVDTILGCMPHLVAPYQSVSELMASSTSSCSRCVLVLQFDNTTYPAPSV